MKYYIIFNPGSNQGKSKRYITYLLKILKEKKVVFKLNITKKLEDAYIYSLDANKNNYDVIVAVGGDGTINQVLNGFYDEKGYLISNAKFGIIYTGTSPDFCKSYNIPIQFEKAVEILLKNNYKNISVGKIKNIRELNTSKYFGCCVNLGMGADIADFSNSGIRKYFGDFLGTLLSILKTFIFFKPQKYCIHFNKKKMVVENVYNISFGKTYYIASGIKVKNSLKANDNKFYMLIVKNVSWINILKVLKTLYCGLKIVNDDVFHMIYFDEAEISSEDNNIKIEYDGDSSNIKLPVKLSFTKNNLKMICIPD